MVGRDLIIYERMIIRDNIEKMCVNIYMWFWADIKYNL